jgi:phage recombination protein Bet
MEQTGLKKTESVSNEQLVSFLDAMGLSKSLSDGEKTTFLTIAKEFQLNPFKREVYCSKYGNGDITIIVGFEVYLKRAERSGLLDGWKVITEGTGDETKAVITIWRKDRKFEFVHEVFLKEYIQRKSDGTTTKFWKEKPITMIKKVAMAQGFRLCFSDELGGMPYTSEEMPDKTEEIATVVIVEPIKKLIANEDFAKAIELIKTGNEKAYKKILTFDLSAEQKQEVATAMSEGINAKIQ